MAGKENRKMKLSDYVAEKIVEYGIKHVFMVTGGGAMHLNHSLGTNKNLECIFNHHEQACAIGAEAYYRLNNKLALVNVTSGPGGTNAITGVYGAFVDSIGMLVISGQVKWETTVRSTGLPLRQYGDQELDIEELVRPVTKYTFMVTEPESIRYHLEKALYLATHPRILRDLRTRLLGELSLRPLFQIEQRVRDMEVAYEIMLKRSIDGSPPVSFRV